MLGILLELALDGLLCRLGYLVIVPFTVEVSYCLRLVVVLLFLFHVKLVEHRMLHFDARCLIAHLLRVDLVFFVFLVFLVFS